MVEAVVYAVDVSKPSAPTRPLPVTYSTFGQARHPNVIGIQAVAEVEILYCLLTATKAAVVGVSSPFPADTSICWSCATPLCMTNDNLPF